jgi:alkylation response protein AidB-like acyl-CoA dehydrogenase
MELSQECVMLQSELRKFAQQVILEKVDEFDKACTFPLDNMKQLAEMGILGTIIPEDMGGSALNLIGLVVSLEEISRVCASTAVIVAAHNAFFAYPILKFGTEEMKKKYLPAAATGAIIGGYANIDTHELTIEKRENTMVLQGKNPVVLNAEANGPFTTFIKNTDDKPDTLAVVVNHDAAGITRTKNQRVTGLKAAGIGEIVFDNYVLTSDSVIGTEANRSTILQATNDFAKVCFSAIALGIAQGATTEAIKYAKERIQFNEPITHFGMVREQVADMTIKTEAARLLIYQAALLYDAGKQYHKAAALAKSFTGHACVEITTSAIQIFGGYGYMKDYPVERYFRDAQVVNVLGGRPTEEKEIIAKEMID